MGSIYILLSDVMSGKKYRCAFHDDFEVMQLLNKHGYIKLKNRTYTHKITAGTDYIHTNHPYYIRKLLKSEFFTLKTVAVCHSDPDHILHIIGSLEKKGITIRAIKPVNDGRVFNVFSNRNDGDVNNEME